MIRTEFIIVGCVLVVLGLILSGVGYDKIQPTPLESVTTFLAEVQGKIAPDELYTSKTNGYVLLSFGGATVATGLAFILRSRTQQK